jgi:hypothetical protein
MTIQELINTLEQLADKDREITLCQDGRRTAGIMGVVTCDDIPSLCMLMGTDANITTQGQA